MKNNTISITIKSAAMILMTLVVLTVSFLASPGITGMRSVAAQSEESVTAASEEPAEKLSFTERIAAGFAESLGKYIPAELVVVFVSMLPILELRAGLFVAKFLNLPLIKAIPLCIVGNIIPIPLILLFIKKIFI